MRYRASQSFDVRPEAWLAARLEGEGAIGGPSSTEPALDAGTLEAGQSVTGWLEFEIGPGSSDVFLDYVDEGGTTQFIVALF